LRRLGALFSCWGATSRGKRHADMPISDNHIPEVPTALRFLFLCSPIVSGAPPPSLWAIFIMPLHGIRHRQLTPSMATAYLQRGAGYIDTLYGIDSTR
jgi:hypothetical protein